MELKDKLILQNLLKLCIWGVLIKFRKNAYYEKCMDFKYFCTKIYLLLPFSVNFLKCSHARSIMSINTVIIHIIWCLPQEKIACFSVLYLVSFGLGIAGKNDPVGTYSLVVGKTNHESEWTFQQSMNKRMFLLSQEVSQKL